MTSKHIYYIMIATIVILVGAIFGGAYLANQQLQKQASALDKHKTKTAVLEEEQKILIKAKKDVVTYAELDKIAKTIVPQDKDQARAVREIINIAAESGIKPTGISFPVSTLGGPKAATTGTATTGAAAKSSSSQSALSQLTPVKGIKGVYNLQITIEQDATTPVPYPQFIDFLSRLEKNRRTAQVSSIGLRPSPTNRNMVSFTLTVNEFIKP